MLKYINLNICVNILRGARKKIRHKIYYIYPVGNNERNGNKTKQTNGTKNLRSKEEA